jgi:hypothetical protein
VANQYVVSKSYATWKIPVQDEKYYFAKYKLFAPATDVLGVIHFGDMVYRPEDNSYFRKSQPLISKFKTTEDPFRYRESFSRRPWVETHGLNVDDPSYQESGVFRPSGFARNDLDFARISYPDNIVNTTGGFKISLLNASDPELMFSGCATTGYATINLNPNNLSGINTFFQTGSGANIQAAANKFKSSLYTKNYLIAKNNVLSTISDDFFYHTESGEFSYLTGANTGNYSNYMIPYPTTIDTQNFYRFNIPTKINARFLSNNVKQ